MKNKTYFFGWENIKWLVRELRDVYSSKKSYFSKKRLESAVAFIVAQWGMIFFLIEHHLRLTMGELLLWAAAEFAISGYMINQIQKEKKIGSETPTETKSEEEVIN